MGNCKGIVVYELESGCNDQLEQVQALLGIGVDVEFTVGAEDNDSINVALQVVDANGDDVEEVYSLDAWLSDDAGGAIAGTAPDGDVAIGTDGTIVEEYTADTSFHLLTEDDGDLDLDIGESGADTWYLNVRLPDGRIATSDAITFAT